MLFAAGLVTDETIRRYVAGLRFERDAVLGHELHACRGLAGEGSATTAA